LINGSIRKLNEVGHCTVFTKKIKNKKNKKKRKEKASMPWLIILMRIPLSFMIILERY
jgi:hypothetical protein